MPSLNRMLPALLLLGASTLARPLVLGGDTVVVALGDCMIDDQAVEPMGALEKYRVDGSGCPAGVSPQEYESRLLDCIGRTRDRGSEGRNSGAPGPGGLDNQTNNIPIDFIAAAREDVQLIGAKKYAGTPSAEDPALNAVAFEDAKDDISPSSSGILPNAATDNQETGPSVSVNTNDQAIVDDNAALNTSGGRTGNRFPAGSNGAPLVVTSTQNPPSAQVDDPAQTGGAIGQAKDSASVSDNGKAAAPSNNNANQPGKPTDTNDRAGVIVSGGATDKSNEAKDRTEAIISLGKAAGQENRLDVGSDQTGVFASVDEAARPANRGGADDRINIVAVGNKGADSLTGSSDRANAVGSFAGTENIAGGALGEPAKCSCGEGN